MSVIAVETRSVSAVDLRGSTESLAPTFQSWLLSVRETASAPTRPRFSVLKAKQLIKYLQKTSSGRQVLVVCVSTVPGLLASLAMPLIPLQDPSLGVQRNAWFYLHLSLTIGYSVAASVTTACAVAGISSDEYTGWAVSAVSLITTALLVVIFLFLGLYWRFPVPFAPVLVYAPWFVCFSIAHIIVLRGKLRSQRLRNGLLFYMPSLCVQVSQLLIYPAYSAFFHASNQRVQILLIGCFPLIKYGIKRNVYLTLAHVKDYAKEEAVSSVEIGASMYQSMIVQGTPSPLATGLVIAVDVVLGVIDIHRLEHRKAVLPTPQLLTSGIALLRDSTLKHDDDHLQSFATRTDGWLKNTHLRRSCRRWLNASIVPLKPESAASDRNVLKRSTRGLRSDPLVLVQTLEMLQSVETILMVEYFEVIVPAMNVVYVAIASQLPSAAYNYKLRPLVGDLGKLEAAVANMLLYTALQLATLVVVSVIVRVRYSLSPLALITFALEKHACSLQGKLVAWLPTIMAFSIVHYDSMETDVTATTGERRLASTIDFGIGANVEEPTLESWLRGVREAAHTATRPRFTILKARQYIKYTQRTRTPRHVFVVCMSALPGLFASLIMPTLPLQDPLLGVRGNSWFYVHLAVTIAYTAFSATIAARSLTGIQRDEYPRCAVGAVALITTMLLVGMFLVLGLYWRFPVPFAPVLVYAPWVVCISLAHILVLRERLRSRRLRNNLLFYLPALSSQVSQLVIYPAYSALFNIAGQWVQILLIAFFPLLKFFIKKNIFIAMHHVKDYAKEEAVSAVEISASMYQSMIVQGTPSPLATGLVIAIDVVLGVVDIKRLAIRKTILPDVELVPAGIRVLADPTLSMADDDLQPFATKTVGYFELVVRTTSVLVRRNARRNLRISVAPTITSTDISRVGSTKRFAPGLQRDLLILTQMLEMLQSIETILFVEYLEVVVPVINAIYVVIASQLPSAIYNSKLREFIGHPAQLRAAVSNIILYTGLQAATLVAVCVVIRVRYGLSPLAQIAFTLEKHSWSLQGKLVAWLPTILAFSVAHYGVDFTFKFDFATKPLE